MAKPKYRPRMCALCGRNTAYYAPQYYYTNNGKLVTERTVQVQARPLVCQKCALFHYDGFIITESYDATRKAILDIAARIRNGWNTLEHVIIFYHSAKYRQGSIQGPLAQR